VLLYFFVVFKLISMDCNYFEIDGVRYDPDNLPVNIKKIYLNLLSSEREIRRLADEIKILNKAKNGYISDLMQEIVGSKSGVDLSVLFDEDKF